MTRKPDNADLWAAIRALNMFNMRPTERWELWREHKDSTLFASRVISEAVRQVSLVKRDRWLRAEGCKP